MLMAQLLLGLSTIFQSAHHLDGSQGHRDDPGTGGTTDTAHLSHVDDVEVVRTHAHDPTHDLTDVEDDPHSGTGSGELSQHALKRGAAAPLDPRSRSGQGRGHRERPHGHDGLNTLALVDQDEGVLGVHEPPIDMRAAACPQRDGPPLGATQAVTHADRGSLGLGQVGRLRRQVRTPLRLEATLEVGQETVPVHVRSPSHRPP